MPKHTPRIYLPPSVGEFLFGLGGGVCNIFFFLRPGRRSRRSMSSGRRRCNSGPRRTRRTSGSRPSWRFAARAAGGKELQEDVQQKNEKQEGIQRGGVRGGWRSRCPQSGLGFLSSCRPYHHFQEIFDCFDNFRHFGPLSLWRFFSFVFFS